jgi:hypothetical protein
MAGDELGWTEHSCEIQTHSSARAAPSMRRGQDAGFMAGYGLDDSAIDTRARPGEPRAATSGGREIERPSNFSKPAQQRCTES